ncbi:MAG TPA: zf-HC2 domain-containing protein [Silvibacterium sp.]|nr:zf-HC2 domain-containing protein [Silvibacterium sp.]
MKHCTSISAQFSDYLDGALSGKAMQRIAAHLDRCTACAEDFALWRRMQRTLGELGPVKPPADLGLRLRVALSQERNRTARNSLARWQVRWQNTWAPFLLRASAGFASAVLLLGSAALLVGAFASPETVEARDEPSDAAASPRFLYSMIGSNAPQAAMGAAQLENSVNISSAQPDSRAVDASANAVVVAAYVNEQGRVYDYRIISGPDDAFSRAQVENLLLFSVFQPAHIFGEPVRGVAVVTFSGISVQG